jgi:hypothetical protein
VIHRRRLGGVVIHRCRLPVEGLISFNSFLSFPHVKRGEMGHAGRHRGGVGSNVESHCAGDRQPRAFHASTILMFFLISQQTSQVAILPESTACEAGIGPLVCSFAQRQRRGWPITRRYSYIYIYMSIYVSVWGASCFLAPATEGHKGSLCLQ